MGEPLIQRKQFTTRPKRRSHLGRDVDSLCSELTFRESSRSLRSAANLSHEKSNENSGKRVSRITFEEVYTVPSNVPVKLAAHKSDASIGNTCICEEVLENPRDVEFSPHSINADLERQLREESEKRSALAALVNSNSSEINDLKEALDAQVKVCCVQTERLPSQQSSAVEAAPFQNQASDICYVSLSREALKDVVDSEILDRKQADEALLDNISCRLDMKKSERQQTHQAHFQDLNAIFDEHLQNYSKEKNEGKEIRVRSSNLSQKGHKVAAYIREKIEKLMNKGNQMNTSLCKKNPSLTAAVVIALLTMIALAQRFVWLPKSSRLQHIGSKR